MSDKNDRTNLESLKQILTLRDEENVTLQNDLLATRKWVDTKMSQQDLFHYRMVANYHQMMVKCKTYEEQLERIYTENNRFKIVAQSLAHKIEELTGCNVENSSSSSENCDCFDDENMSLEESSKMLTDELCAYKRRAENARNELAEAKDRLSRVKDELVKSAETEACLRKCVDNLTAFCESPARTNETAVIDAGESMQSAACAEKHLMAEQLESAVKDLKGFNARVQEECRTMAENWNAMKTEYEKLSAANRDLMNELNTREATASALREKIVMLEQLSYVDRDHDCETSLNGQQRPSDVQMPSGNDEDDDAKYLSQLLLHGDGDDVKGPSFSSLPLTDIADCDVPPEKPLPPTELSDDQEIIELLERYKNKL